MNPLQINLVQESFAKVAPISEHAAVLFYDGPFDPAQRLALLDRYKVTVFCASATEFRLLDLTGVTPSSFGMSRASLVGGPDQR